MGDINQSHFIRRHRERLAGPVLEIGSRDYGNTEQLRPFFQGEDYLGVDMLEGKGVDKVVDFTRPFDEVDAAVGGQRFGTIICLSVLEHCDQPFLMAQNMARLLAPGGCVVVSVPFVFKFHGYPSDYWRFTPEGVKKLFQTLTFEPDVCEMTSSIEGDFWPLSNDSSMGRIVFNGSWLKERGHPVSACLFTLLRPFMKLSPMRHFYRYRNVFPHSMVTMMGVQGEASGG